MNKNILETYTIPIPLDKMKSIRKMARIVGILGKLDQRSKALIKSKDTIAEARSILTFVNYASFNDVELNLIFVKQDQEVKENVDMIYKEIKEVLDE